MTTQVNKYREMTEAQLVAAAERHDRTVNEGGEGYNPYTAELRDRAAKANAADPMTRDDLVRRLERLDCAAAREAGTYDAARCDAIRAQIRAMDDDAETKFADEWTCDVTIARRAEWNARVQAGEFGDRKIDAAAVRAAESAQGWDLDGLRRAVKLHNLPARTA